MQRRTEQDMPPQQPPTILAMVPADRILVDVATGKNTIEGTFQSLRAEAFPFVCERFAVYVILPDGYAQTRVRLNLVDVDEEHEPIFELETVVEFSDPLTAVDIAFTREAVTFPEPGEYRLQLFAAGEPLMERRLQIGFRGTESL
jgi:hypothetical protein